MLALAFLFLSFLAILCFVGPFLAGVFADDVAVLGAADDPPTLSPSLYTGIFFVTPPTVIVFVGLFLGAGAGNALGLALSLAGGNAFLALPPLLFVTASALAKVLEIELPPPLDQDLLLVEPVRPSGLLPVASRAPEAPV